MSALWLCLAFLMVADIVTTWCILKEKNSLELNPLLRWLHKKGGLSLLLYVKAFLTGFVLFAFYMSSHKVGMVIVCVGYLLIFTFNVIQLTKKI